MKKTYLKIQPVTISTLEKDIVVNGIFWRCPDLTRGANSAKLLCELVYIPETTGTTGTTGTTHTTIDMTFVPTLYSFVMDIPNSVLSIWLDDSVIDTFVLTYSPKFIKA